MIALPDVASGILAVGWATVDLDRAARELSHLLAPGSRFDQAPSSVILGARCRAGQAADHPALRIVLLEPETEGRLAATLARSGEGWAATWLLDPGIGVGRRPGSGPRPVSGARPGPLGRESLALDGSIGGSHRLLVEAVPSPP